MLQLQGQKGEQAGDSSARELQLEEQLAEARSIIDEQVLQRGISEPNLLITCFCFLYHIPIYCLVHGF